MSNLIVTVRDLDILSNLDPQQLIIYLQAQGWHHEIQIDNKESVWIKTTDLGEEFEITLPLNPGIRAFALRMYEILETLEKAEGRSQLYILSNLITTVPNTEIQGMVIQVEAENHPGNIIIIGSILGKLRHIHIKLNELEYNLAIKAYQERLPVVCTGDLIKENSFFVLKNPRHFALYDSAIN
jgi:hypothetical protein